MQKEEEMRERKQNNWTSKGSSSADCNEDNSLQEPSCVQQFVSRVIVCQVTTVWVVEAETNLG